MNRHSEAMFEQFSPAVSRRKLSHDFVGLASDMLPLWDVAMMLLTPFIANYVYAALFTASNFDVTTWKDYEKQALAAAIIVPFILGDRRFGTEPARRQTPILVRDHVTRFLKFAGVVLAVGFSTRTIDTLPRAWAGIWLGLSFFFTIAARLLLAQHLRHLEQRGVLTQTIAVVGAGPIADRLIRYLLQNQRGTIELLGVFDDRGSRNDGRMFIPKGNVSDLLELGKTRMIDWILVALPSTADDRVLEIVHTLKTLAVPVGLCPESVGLKLPNQVINYVGGRLPVMMLADRPIRHWDAVIKWFEDLVLGTLIALPLLPLLGIVALLIKLDSPGPVLFRQRRHAWNNSEFYIYKFRTMRWEPDSGASAGVIRQTARDDGRITRLGRFLRKSSIDELPQLFNVLRGEMSLVGPRPHAVDMRTEAQLGHEIVDTYAHRHRVKPGITGWSQVNGSRGATETVEQLRRRVELDIYYVENWSLYLDIKILFMTFVTVICGKNAF
ncbi:MAG: undecaprenyl-phosphate glucose phosphotransferase [Nevskia sp.]